MNKQPKTEDSIEEIRKKITNDILVRFETTILATRGDSYHRSYARNDTATQVLTLITTSLIEQVNAWEKKMYKIYGDDGKLVTGGKLMIDGVYNILEGKEK